MTAQTADLWRWQHHLGSPAQRSAVHVIDTFNQARHILCFRKLLTLDVLLHQGFFKILQTTAGVLHKLLVLYIFSDVLRS